MHKNTVKLYNVIFPIFILFLLPQFLIFGMIGNLVIDGLIVITVLKISKVELSTDVLYKTIFKIFGVGYLADLVGALILIAIYRIFESTINYFHIWANPVSVIVHFIVIGITAFLIFKFNIYILRKVRLDDNIIFRLAISLAIITAPWTFLISASILN